jgi:hypothetical protein
MFVPVRRLIRYVDDARGNLSLMVSLDQGAIEASPDMDHLVRLFWRGLWIAIVRRISPEMNEAILTGDGEGG